MVPDLVRSSSALALLLVAACSNAEEKQSPDPRSEASAITRTAQVEVNAASPLEGPEFGDAEAAAEGRDTAPIAKDDRDETPATMNHRQNEQPIASGQSQIVATQLPLETPKGFAICAACHSAQLGAQGIGPSLAGVYGTKAGSKSFAYSSAMTTSNISWNETALDEFLLSPAKKVPGTTMAFAGVRDQQARREIIEYLKSL